jgi:hypothetical protein
VEDEYFLLTVTIQIGAKKLSHDDGQAVINVEAQLPLVLLFDVASSALHKIGYGLEPVSRLLVPDSKIASVAHSAPHLSRWFMVRIGWRISDSSA